MSGPEIHPNHAQAYGDHFSAALKGSNYSEAQCGACPHDHRCCDLIVGCTPVEALGIIRWIEANHPDPGSVFRRVEQRARELHDHQLGFKMYVDVQQRNKEIVEDWARERKKCVFYDGEAKRCSIYPVRPASCRKVWGRGDCNADGLRVESENPIIALVRALRVQEAFLMLRGQETGEMTWLILQILSGTTLKVDRSNQALLLANPADLREEDLLYGLAGAQAWIETEPQPQLEESTNGSP